MIQDLIIHVSFQVNSGEYTTVYINMASPNIRMASNVVFWFSLLRDFSSFSTLDKIMYV